jgi:hypothetical protein
MTTDTIKYFFSTAENNSALNGLISLLRKLIKYQLKLKKMKIFNNDQI